MSRFHRSPAGIGAIIVALLLVGRGTPVLAQCSSAKVTNFAVTTPNAAEQGTITIGWQFTPATCCPYLKMHIEGPNFYVEEQIHDPNYSGQKVFSYDVSCVAPGTYNFVGSVTYQGHQCGVKSEDAVAPITVADVNSAVSVSLRKLPTTGKIEAKVNYAFPPSGARNVDLYLSSWRDDEGMLHSTPQHLAGHLALQASGQWVYEFDPPSSSRWIEVRATASRCTGSSESFDSLDCLECSAQAGDPVSMLDGTMTLDDSDPLPPMIGGVGLDRTYVSSEGASGTFGRGWFTIFDRMLAVTPSAAGHAVTMSTGRDAFVTSCGPLGGPYQQVSPRSVGSLGALIYNSALDVYELRNPGDHVVSRYSGNGRFVGWRDLSSGRLTTIAYDAAGLPQSMADSWSGLTWTITTDATSRRITSITVAGTPSILWEYSYDASGNLQSVQLNGAIWRAYEYENNLLTAARDALGNLIESHTYDSYGRATSSHGASDEITLIEYDLPGPNPDETLTRVTSATGATTDFVLKSQGTTWRTLQTSGGCASCGARDSVYAYDREGRVLRQQSSSGYVTASTYGIDGQLAGTQNALKPVGCDPASDPGHCRLNSANLAAALLEPTSATVITTYKRADPAWTDRVTTILRPSVAVPEQSSTQTFSFHPVTGAVVSSAVCGWVPEATACSQRSTVTTFYETTDSPAFALGGVFLTAWLALPQPALLPRSIDGPRTDVADVTSFVYYPVDFTVPGRLRGRLAATKNAAGLITHYDDYDVFGNALRVVDPNGVATERTYDALGRTATTTTKSVAGCNTSVDPLCATDLTTTMTYAPSSGPLQRQERPAGGVTSYTYDSRGRVQTVSRGPSASDLRERIETTYDTLTGKKNVERTLAYEGAAWVEKTRQSFAYETHSLLQAVTHADGAAVHYTYDAEDRLATTRDENHAAPNTSYAYDPAGRLATVTQTLAGATNGVITTHYTYDVAGNLTSVTDPNGNVTSYVHDDFGQLLTQQSSVTGTTSYAYDNAGNLMQTTDANGATTARTYDAENRILSAVSSHGGDTESVTRTYDNSTAGAYGLGRLTAMEDPSGATSYAYDRRGLLRQESHTMWDAQYVQTYGYDADGNRKAVGYPSGRLVTYTFDHAGRPTSASGTFNSQSTPYVTAATYLPFGPPKSLTLGNGTIETRSYNSRYLPLTSSLTSGAATLAQYTYTNDPAGNITAIADGTSAMYNRTFGYDDLHRLTTANTGSAL